MSARTKTYRKRLPRPFLKWAGGKGQLLPELMERVEAAGDFGRYHEPFVGGGALFFELKRLKRLRKHAALSDNNQRLIEIYDGVKTDVEAVIRRLLSHEAVHGKEYYYQVRAKVPDTLEERAARLIYLNKTCFNGLFRENSKGLFNTPFGRYKNPLICDSDNLREAAKALRRAKLAPCPFEDIVNEAERDDLVYFDPPYHPVSKTASFTAYHKGGFGESGQRQLADVFRALNEKGVKVLLSNSDTKFTQDLYEGFTIDRVYATRRVNSRADRRGKVSELLVRNF